MWKDKKNLLYRCKVGDCTDVDYPRTVQMSPPVDTELIMSEEMETWDNLRTFA